MRRRVFVAAVLGVACASAGSSSAQQPAPKLPRVGIVSPAQSDDTAIFRAFRHGLREHGYIESRNIVLEFRLARGDYDALPRLVSELVNLPVDVIVTDGGPGVAKLAKQATQRIPIVMGTSGGDPVASGLVDSLSRPGGNITGLTLMQKELSAKRVDLLKAALPDAKEITVLLNPANAGAETNFRATEQADGGDHRHHQDRSGDPCCLTRSACRSAQNSSRRGARRNAVERASGYSRLDGSGAPARRLS